MKNLIVVLSLGIFLSLLLVAATTTTIIENANAQTKEQNEKLMECHDYKAQDTMDTKRLLVNCIEYVHSDYDVVEEFVAEEHPELLPKE